MSKINIDFLVHSNPYFLGVLDMSNWELIEDEPSIIEITQPGYSSCVTHYFDKCKNNIFNSIHLGLNCVEDCGEAEKLTLLDGIYTIVVKGSPDTYFKKHYYLKTDLFDMEVDKLYIDFKQSQRRDKTSFINKMKEVEFLIRGAEAHLRFDNINLAGQMFEKAQEMVEDLKNCKTCFTDTTK